MGWIVRLWAKIILKASFIEFKIEGEENIKPDMHYFFAANPSKPGYHSFAKSLSEHKRNARKFHKYLNSKGIKK